MTFSKYRPLAATLIGGLVANVCLPASGGTSVDTAPTFGPLPVVFEPNVGQAPPDDKFVARGNGYGVALSDNAVHLWLGELRWPQTAALGSNGHRGDRPEKSGRLEFHLQSASPHPLILGEQAHAGVSNYLIGRARSKWHRNVPNFGAVRYRAVYPGVDWVIYGNPRQLEFDFVVAPHANAGRIRLAVKGADRLSLDANGDLLLAAGDHVLRQLTPTIYQTNSRGERERIEGHYVMRGHVVSFAIGKYDPNRPLTIDPTLEFSTYLGGSLGDYGYGIAVDGTGSVYVVGQASSGDFPVVKPFQGTNKGDNAFIAKFNATGNELVYSTFLGGNAGEVARSVAVDGSGNAYVTGWTFSTDFPTVNAFQQSFRATGQASEQAFVAKLDATGSGLVYSTYLGGSGDLNSAAAIAIDSSGSAYVTGSTNSMDFPVAGGVQRTLRGRLSAFVTKFSPDGSALAYSTFLGGSAADQGGALAVDRVGSAYIVGNTNSVDFPLVNAYQSLNKAISGGGTNSTAFASKLDPTGSALVYSTYLGGSISDGANAVAVDHVGSAYVAGYTCSPDFPTVNAFQKPDNFSCAGGPNAFVSKLGASGSALVYSTYLGGRGGGNGIIGDNALGIAVDGSGRATVVGYTTSSNFPLISPLQAANKAGAIGGSNIFITQFNEDGSALTFSTYFGGSGSWGPAAGHTTIPFGDSAAAVALDGIGNIYVTGQTGSADFPTQRPYQSTNKTATAYGTAPTAFVTKLSAQAAPPVAAPTSVTATAGDHQATLSWSAVPDATSYNIYQGLTPGGEAAEPVQTVYSGTMVTLMGLSNGDAYFYVITAVSLSGESAQSVEVSVTPVAASGKSSGGGAVGPALLILLGLYLIVSRATEPARSRRSW